MMEVGPGTPIWSLGLMTGTSMDAVDAALIRTDGAEIFEIGPGLSSAYDRVEKLRHVMAEWERYRQPACPALAEDLATAEWEVREPQARAAVSLISGNTGSPPKIVGFHGQTIMHRPDQGWTWQLGDGQRLATTLRRPVVWDFRSEDMASGGEGAPLAPFYHFALAKHIRAREPLAFLNLGGVGNVTWIDPTKTLPEEPGALLAFDTGPGNALVNDWMQAQTGTPMDRDGAAAAAGRVHRDRLNSNAARAYLDRTPPKSLDRNEFAPVLRAMAGLQTEDGAATLTAFTAQCVAESLRHMPAPPTRWLVCGGGRLNQAMMEMLAETLDAPVAPVEDEGLDGDMLEAQAFAFLAVRVLRGLPTSAPGTTGCRAPVSGGRISYPD